MSSIYPAAVKTWPVTTTENEYPNNLKTIFTGHITTIYPEITAIQNELGAGGVRTSIAASTTSSYTPIDGQVWTNLQARLANLERAAMFLPTLRVSISGGSQIQPATASVVGLSIRAQTSQTGNLLEIRNSSNAIVNRFESDGSFTGVIDGGSA